MKIAVFTCFILLSFNALRTFALPDIIGIGGIFGPGDKRTELAFQYATERINADRAILPRSQLHAYIEHLPADDSFHANRRVCQILRRGVAAIFGPANENTANHVQSICDALEVPHIETRWDYKVTRDAYSLNLHPHPSSLGKAYHDVIKALNWPSFTVLYDTNLSLLRLQTLLQAKEWKIHVRQLGEGNDWRPLLKELKKTQVTRFVIDVAQEKVEEVLKQASQIGLMREYHSYLITSLDLFLINMEDYRYGGTNITAVRLLDPNKPEVKKVVEEWKYGELRYGRNVDPDLKISTEAALMYDAVHIFARAIDDLDRSQEVEITPLYCEGDKTWQHGNSLVNYMKWYSARRLVDSARQSPVFVGGVRVMPPSPENVASHLEYVPEYASYGRYSNSYPYPGSYNIGDMPHMNFSKLFDQVQVYGLTGLIKFDTAGFRSDFQLEITELDAKDGLKKVGIWTKDGGANYTRSFQDSAETIVQNLQNRTLIITTAETAPYTMLREASESLVGNERYEGFCVDLIDKIAEELGFNYTFRLVADGSYGSKNHETGEWNGMVRELLDHKADLAIVDFTITYEREEAVDFSMPFMNLGIGIIYTKPQKKAPSLFSFMSPFSVDVWIYMATAYLGVSVLLFILARMSPKEWDCPYPCIQEPEELENCFTLKNSLWFIIGTFLCQGCDIAPRAVSTRIVAGIWWFFTLIMISSYTANLAAFLTVERMEAAIESAEDLAKQTKIKYGCKEGGSTYAFFRDSKIPTYQRMWSSMINARPTVFTQVNDDGVERVSSSNGLYAFLMESSSIEYEIERRCDLMQVGGLLDSKSYGIALPPGSPYTEAISSSILKLKETGVLHELKTKWWKQRKGGGRCLPDEKAEAASAAELGLDNVGGVFVVVAAGGAAACFVACCEFLWKARKLAAQQGDSFWHEMMEELRFIADCSKNEKPVKKSPDTESTLYSTSYEYSNKK